MKKLNYVIIVAGIVGVLTAIAVSPDIATKYLALERHMTSEGLRNLRVYRPLAWRAGFVLLTVGAVSLALEGTPLQIASAGSLARKDVIILAIAAGVIATLVGYRYGSGNHVAELPIAKRAVDDSYISQDFYVNASAEFGPRFYFSHLVAFLAGIVPMPAVYLILTLLANVLTAVISGLFARDLFDGSNLVGVLAVCLVMSVDTFGLGYRSSIPRPMLIPALLAQPLIFLSVWSGFRQQPLFSSLSAGIASLIHPTFGLETGAIVLFSLVGARVLRRGLAKPSLENRTNVVRILPAFLLLFIFAAFSFIPYQAVTAGIDSSRYVSILSCFRHPHHDCPSTFGKADYLRLVAFLIALSISWHWWKRSARDRYLHTQFPIFVGAILSSCVSGYVFVEIVPWRLWAIARTFRLVFLIKWLGLIWIAGTIGCLLIENERFDAYLLLISVVSPITIAMTHFAVWAGQWATRVSGSLSRFLASGPVLVLVVTCIGLSSEPSLEEALLFLTFVFMAVSLNTYWRNRWHATELVILITSLWLLVLIGGGLQVPALRARLPGFEPVISLSDLEGQDIDVAKWARHNTSKNTVFLTPPMLGEFRLVAERAIVVDFKAFPFQDEAMLEWQERLFDCYGVPTAKGFDAAREMDANYRAIDDSAMLRLRSRYHISYAVLYSDTETGFPTVYSNKKYKVVRVGA